MPGIAGIIARESSPGDSLLLEGMLDSMMHEPFYRRTVHEDPTHGWHCGRVAFEESLAEQTPAMNRDRSLVLLLAGEFARDGAHAGESAAARRAACTALLDRYEQQGLAFLRRLNGWFSGIILDARNARAVVFNDRYGLQKIYYHDDGRAFYFASEAKALLRVLPALRSVEPNSVAEYLCYDCVLDDHSYFRGVNLIPGGSAWIATAQGVQRTTYFDPKPLEQAETLPAAGFLEQLGDTFKRVLPRYLDGTRLTLGLTGGLDTRLIMACLPSDCSRYTGVTFGGQYRDSGDLLRAREVCARSGIPHWTLRLDQKFLSRYAEHASRAIYITDGLSDATNLDSVDLSNRARQWGPILLLGMFGSQVLGRVRRALRYRLPDERLISRDFQPLLNEAATALQQHQSSHDLTYLAQREIPWYWSRFTAPQMSQLTLRSPFLDNDFFDLLYRAPRTGFDGTQFEMATILRYRPELIAIRTNKGSGGRSPWPFSVLGRKIIQARMTADRVLNWDTLPHSLHHVVARVDSQVLTPFGLHRLILGYELFRHYNRWFRAELASYLKAVLLDPRTLSRPYWNRQFIEQMVHDHVRGRRQYLAEIRKVLTLELVHRVMLEDAPRGAPVQSDHVAEPQLEFARPR